MEKDIFNKDALAYDEWFKVNDKLFSLELAAIRELLPANGKGIEIGVGTGLFAAKLGIEEGDTVIVGDYLEFDYYKA